MVRLRVHVSQSEEGLCECREWQRKDDGTRGNGGTRLKRLIAAKLAQTEA